MIPPKQEDTSKSAAATFLRASWAKMLAVNDKVLTRREGYIKHMKEWVWWTSISFKSPLIMSCIGSNTNTVVQTTGRWSSLRTDAFLPCLTAQRMYSRQRMEGFALKNPSCPAPSGCLISGCMKSKLVMDAWSPKSIRRGAVAANHH